MTKRRRATQTYIERRMVLNTVWPVCYSSLLVIVHSYLIYQSVSRYKVYRLVAPKEAVYHLVSLCVSALLVPVIVLLNFIKTGSYTNDGAPVGDSFLKREISEDNRPQLRRFLRGAPPIAPILHIVSAYLLLIPNMFTMARIPHLLLTEVTGEDVRKDAFLDSFALRVRISSMSPEADASIPSTNFELANLIIALLVYTYRMVAVFWKTCKLFSVIFWFQLLASIALHIMAYMGFSILYAELKSSLQNEQIYLLSEEAVIMLYTFGNAVLFTSSWCVLHFGYGAVLDRINVYLRQIAPSKRPVEEFAVFLPHGLALISILFYIACNAPIMYDYVTMYSQTKNHILIIHLISCVIYMLFWISLWFAFTIKQNWNFKINDIALKRYAILQNRGRSMFVEGAEHEHGEVDAFNSGDVIDAQMDTHANSEDNLSNSTTSTYNGATPRSANGILLHKLQNRQKRKCSEQKVKFQEATRIVIETNLDSDLDTIPESDTERADSAMFSGSGGSNDSNESNSTQQQNLASSFQEVVKPDSKELVLNPQNIHLVSAQEQNHEQQQRMWSSMGDLQQTSSLKITSDYLENGRPQSVMSQSYTGNHARLHYSPRNAAIGANNENFVSNGHTQMFEDAGMSSAV